MSLVIPLRQFRTRNWFCSRHRHDSNQQGAKLCTKHSATDVANGPSGRTTTDVERSRVARIWNRMINKTPKTCQNRKNSYGSAGGPGEEIGLLLGSLQNVVSYIYFNFRYNRVIGLLPFFVAARLDRCAAAIGLIWFSIATQNTWRSAFLL